MASFESISYTFFYFHLTHFTFACFFPSMSSSGNGVECFYFHYYYSKSLYSVSDRERKRLYFTCVHFLLPLFILYFVYSTFYFPSSHLKVSNARVLLLLNVWLSGNKFGVHGDQFPSFISPLTSFISVIVVVFFLLIFKITGASVLLWLNVSSSENRFLVHRDQFSSLISPFTVLISLLLLFLLLIFKGTDASVLLLPKVW